MTIESGSVVLESETVDTPRVIFPGAITLVTVGVGIEISNLILDLYTPFAEGARVTISRVGVDGTYSTILAVRADGTGKIISLPSPVRLDPGDRIGLLVSTNPVFGDLSYTVETDPVGAGVAQGGATLPGAYAAPAPAPIPARPWWRDFL